MTGEEQFNGVPSGVQLDKAAADDIAPGGEGTGHFTGMDNLLGPQYGQPGYAATHNWEGSNGENTLPCSSEIRNVRIATL